MFDCTLERLADRQVFAPPKIVDGDEVLITSLVGAQLVRTTQGASQ